MRVSFYTFHTHTNTQTYTTHTPRHDDHSYTECDHIARTSAFRFRRHTFEIKTVAASAFDKKSICAAHHNTSAAAANRTSFLLDWDIVSCVCAASVVVLVVESLREGLQTQADHQAKWWLTRVLELALRTSENAHQFHSFTITTTTTIWRRLV